MKHESGGSWTREEDLMPEESDSQMSDDEIRGGDTGYDEEINDGTNGTEESTGLDSRWDEEASGLESGTETSMEDEEDLEDPQSTFDRGSSEADY